MIFLLNFVYFEENHMAKSLSIFSSFMTVGPDVHCSIHDKMKKTKHTANHFMDSKPHILTKQA